MPPQPGLLVTIVIREVTSMGRPSIAVEADLSVLDEYRTSYSTEIDVEASMDGNGAHRERSEADLDEAKQELLQEMRYRGESTGPTERTSAKRVKLSDCNGAGRRRVESTEDELAGQDRSHAFDEPIGTVGRSPVHKCEGGSVGQSGEGTESVCRLKDEHCIDDLYA